MVEGRTRRYRIYNFKVNTLSTAENRSGVLFLVENKSLLLQKKN